MGRLIDEEELQEYIIHEGCERGCGYIDERDLKYIPTVDAIPKDQYEAKLKADTVVILDKIRAEIEQLPTTYIEILRPHSVVERDVVELDAVMRIINKY